MAEERNPIKLTTTEKGCFVLAALLAGACVFGVMTAGPMTNPSTPNSQAVVPSPPAGAYGSSTFAGNVVDLNKLTVVHLPDEKAISNADKSAPTFFIEELEKRIQRRLKSAKTWPDDATPVIAVASIGNVEAWPYKPPSEKLDALRATGSEGYFIGLDNTTRKAPTLWVIGKDGRGTLFGAGKLLRILSMGDKWLKLHSPVDLVSAPKYPIRGHQLGYRNRANSWDAWTMNQFEQYFRDLIAFGMNSVENIPFQDESTSPLMKYSRRDFNKQFGELCAKYDLDHWVWTPVEFDLTDESKRTAELAKHEQFYQDTPRLDGVFFPGGDPGHNHANLVIPFLEDIAKLLAKYHPKAKVWLSLQWFDADDQEFTYEYLKKNTPDWFGGLVCGPSSPGLRETRAKLDKRYKLRNYPDITHSVRCQYPVPYWDRAFNLTLGRECINPRPVGEKFIHNLYAEYSDGFITYTDGVHDDVNKVIWNLAGWDPDFNLREGLIEYASYLMNASRELNPNDPKTHAQKSSQSTSHLASPATITADALLALENNWHGSIRDNGAIDSTFMMWHVWTSFMVGLEPTSNWRSSMHAFRAMYDAYQRHRAIYESEIELEVNALLSQSEESHTSETIKNVRGVFSRWELEFDPEQMYFEPINDLADQLFKSIQLQTSVEKYHASEPERGCVMDFVNYPLNDRLYYEFRFGQIAALTDEAERARQLRELGNWTNPGPGGFYDDVGNIGNSPHAVVEGDWRFDPEMERVPNTEFTWANGGNDNRRLAWQDWLAVTAMKYEGLDPDANYEVTATVAALAPRPKLRANGEEAEALPDPPTPPTPPTAGKFGGAIAMRAWRIPEGAITDGSLELRFEYVGTDGKTRNADLAEVWVRKK